MAVARDGGGWKIRGGSILPVFIYRWGIRRFFPGHAGFEAEVGEGGRGVRRAMEDLQETGCTNVSMQLYPGARHELFHEINREEVFGDIVDWVSKL